MTNLYYDLYCDESGTSNSIFHFGAIHCSRQRAHRLVQEIQAFRIQTGLDGEMKWTKVSRAMLASYTQFVDIFLNDPYATFTLSEIIKGEYWRNLATSSDSQFLNAYFHFLEQAMWASARYAIFLDDSTSKRYKFKSLHYCLNLPDIQWKRQKKVLMLSLANSRQNDLIQLVDVVLGALTSRATAPHKIMLSNYVKERIATNTKYGRPKLIQYNWTAPEKRRFNPNI